MKKFLAAGFAMMVTAVLFAQQVNDPNAVVRDAKDFHGISVSSAFDVYLTQSNTEAVAVSAAEEKYRERITVEVKAGILHVGYDSRGININTGNRKLKAYISFKNIDRLKVSGACDVFISGTLKAENLSIDQSGASDLKGKLDVNKLTVDLSGASDILVNGTAAQLSIEASGASSFKGFDLATETCDARASGASDIKVTVSKELSVNASGASAIRYRGKGLIRDVKTSGSSSVSRDGKSI
ncbi:MAG: head GIN domain-containing protein [Bacteroidota bacterium]